jgi:hypothetical protein
MAEIRQPENRICAFRLPQSTFNKTILENNMNAYELAHPKALRRVLILGWCCVALPWLGFHWVSGAPLFFITLLMPIVLLNLGQLLKPEYERHAEYPSVQVALMTAAMMALVFCLFAANFIWDEIQIARDNSVNTPPAMMVRAEGVVPAYPKRLYRSDYFVLGGVRMSCPRDSSCRDEGAYRFAGEQAVALFKSNHRGDNLLYSLSVNGKEVIRFADSRAYYLALREQAARQALAELVLVLLPVAYLFYRLVRLAREEKKHKTHEEAA